MRLDKFVAMVVAVKRKDARGLIEAGRIMVNGEKSLVCPLEIDEDKDVIKLDGRVLKPVRKVYYMMNKPAGYMTALKDSDSRVVLELFKPIHRKGIFHVGRLDKDTEGMLLFTNDGDFEHNVMSPLNHVVKKYLFIALGSMDENKRESLLNGVFIGKDEAEAKALEMEIIKNSTTHDKRIIEKYDIKRFYDGISEHYPQPLTIGSISISEGRKHQVKRMVKAVGCHVVYLKRISIGNLTLDEKLKEGEYRELKPEELSKVLE